MMTAANDRTGEQILTLGEALPLEIARVRDGVLPIYLSIGAPVRSPP